MIKQIEVNLAIAVKVNLEDKNKNNSSLGASGPLL
jgi:hypothetical protein